MKKNLLIITISLLTLSSHSQEPRVRTFDLNSLIELHDMSMENTHEWLTHDGFFTFVSKNNKYDGYIYGLNYNVETTIASIWLHKYYDIDELFLIGWKQNLISFLNELTPYEVMSHKDIGGSLITVYHYSEKDFISIIDQDSGASIRMMNTPKNETERMKAKRYKMLTKQTEN